MPKHFCCVPDCNSASAKKNNLQKYPWMKGVKLFPFPLRKAAVLRKQWIDLVRRHDFTPKKYTRICSRHFLKGQTPRDDPKAKPTLFPYNNWGKKCSPLYIFSLIISVNACRPTKINLLLVHAYLILGHFNFQFLIRLFLKS